MLSDITWPQYFLTITVLTIAYYLFIWMVFYRAAIPVFFSNSKDAGFLQREQYMDEILQAIKHIEEELKPAFIGRSNKNELLFALRSTLRRNAKWDHPEFRDQLNEFIVTQSSDICSIRLDEDDLRAVWL